MRVLVDTHTLIWWATDDPKLSRTAQAARVRALGFSDLGIQVEHGQHRMLIAQAQAENMPIVSNGCLRVPRTANLVSGHEIALD